MRTKNAKRLWPVPVTLGVMALAALLAFGLMATTGAQPAAAQDDPAIDDNDGNWSMHVEPPLSMDETPTLATSVIECSRNRLIPQRLEVPSLTKRPSTSW